MGMVLIIVPVYKDEMSVLEKISYKQLHKVLGNYEICIVAPEYLHLSEEILKSDVRVEWFEKKYFQNVAAYSKLLLSVEFYERFIDYKYILIYQLDAFVFCDRLEYFCKLGYDYIGAPWLTGVCEYENLERKILYVGNGGFSLRNVEKSIYAIKNKVKEYEIYRNRNEDAFFSACDAEDCRVAPVNVALEFAFERQIRGCFKQNHNRLPFGCHAWERYDLEFLYKYIEKFGYKLDENIIAAGNEDKINENEYIWKKRNSKLIESDVAFYGINDKLNSLFEKKVKFVYLWGAGYIGKYIRKLFLDSGICVAGYIDSAVEKQKNGIDGLAVYAPAEIREDMKIIVTADRKKYGEIQDLLINSGMVYKNNFIFFEDLLPELEMGDYY